MGIIYAIKGRSNDDMDFQFATFDKDQNRQDKKGFPAKLTIGPDPSRMCTVYYNETASGVIANLYGPIPKRGEDGRPILKIVDGQERYDWMTYTDKETGRDVWVEAPLGTFSAREGKKSGNNYIFAKIYHDELLVPMAQLSYLIRHSPEKKEEAIRELNALQSEHGNSILLNMFPASAIAARKLGLVYKEEFPFTEMPSVQRKADKTSDSPSPS